ncbi:MAG: CPCC family cysteine-rich protein [Patescibacteria group bacterium]|nr:CPCC family cysteine-rich protein [Patescibacteria group bacterium]
MPKFPCPCCGYRTMSEQPPGTFQICPVCYWEDDNVQFNDPTFEGGANEESLNQARANFAKCRASSPRFVGSVRAPLPDEAG